MPKEDYLIKYLEKLGRVIAAMLALRKANQPESSLQLADEVYKELLSISVSDLLDMSEDSFHEAMKKENYNASYIESLAQITHEAAKAYSIREDKENEIKAYKKSLQLYQLLNAKDKTFSFEREEIISSLNEIINNWK